MFFISNLLIIRTYVWTIECDAENIAWKTDSIYVFWCIFWCWFCFSSFIAFSNKQLQTVMYTTSTITKKKQRTRLSWNSSSFRIGVCHRTGYIDLLKFYVNIMESASTLEYFILHCWNVSKKFEIPVLSTYMLIVVVTFPTSSSQTHKYTHASIFDGLW